ncbi:hypothetical protein GCM10027280_04540 [Micromonospora polyrhachis]|uniref:hypothetical protein n=1 Tax=Micromonospora polyrhachis TaxID=1282883 RepID=UPI00160D49E3|nr:hypothetical protein [Micromonospora polyrhachis]
MSAPVPGPFRGVPAPPGGARPGPSSVPPPSVAPVDGSGSGHPAVDAAIQALVNAANLSPADQIAQYEAAHQTLRETLATIDQN